MLPVIFVTDLIVNRELSVLSSLAWLTWIYEGYAAVTTPVTVRFPLEDVTS
jgi:hypothetical protein